MTLILYIWVGLTFAIILFILITRKLLNKPLGNLNLVHFLAVALEIYAALSSSQLIWQALTNQELQKLLGGENIPVLILGGVAVIWIAIREVYKLCTERQP
ncbi:hypothetical protein H6F51_09770 [Cyanobacteria bacterium FACHB-DQ100]|nr:hypothetical protein [Cyanobacteria bacterium FACHB-DQ100]